jgi:cyclopropane-fatty-acyl-phospholipid synthase
MISNTRVEDAAPAGPRLRRPSLAWMCSAERIVRDRLARSGILVNDGESALGIRVHDTRFYRRILVGGSLGLGESYVDGWWDCEALDEMVAGLMRGADAGDNWTFGALAAMRRALRARVLNRQSVRSAARDVASHYDRDESLFRAMLDKRLVYSCAYWDRARTLDEAQEAKLELVCRKLDLRAGQRVLDLGCGWGGFARYAAERCGVHVVGVTVAPRQASAAADLCAGLPIEIRVQDYRDMSERFDRIVSLGMLEHVGYKNHRAFMSALRRCLAPDGVALVQVIGNRHSTTGIDAWMDRHVFPGAALPSVAQLGAAMEPLFVLEDWHNFGADYDRTLLAWHRNFECHWPELARRYDERFRRLWRYFLLSCAGAFRARHTQLWQLVLSPGGVAGGYRSPR